VEEAEEVIITRRIIFPDLEDLPRAMATLLKKPKKFIKFILKRRVKFTKLLRQN
jgi:hypothetical protein